MTRLEQNLTNALLGRPRASVLMTDAYKFSMAQAGRPGLSETFYLSLRRAGWYFIPFDLEAVVCALCPEPPTSEEQAFLDAFGFALRGETREALRKTPRVKAAPKGSWVREGEPIVTVTAPSALASWLETVVIWLHQPIQIATAVLLDGVSEFRVASTAEAEIVRCTLEAIGADERVTISVGENAAKAAYREAAELIATSVGSEVERVFEVGMRGAGCIANHRTILTEAKRVGIAKTSNVFLAHELGMTPVGTTGHEHQLRWGSDRAGFRAVRDMRPQMPSYLFDTYDAMACGIPAAIEALRETPKRPASVRFDSGCYEEQIRAFLGAAVEPTFVFMDSMRPTRIAELEALCEAQGIPAAKRQYGVGGYLHSLAPNPYTRDRVAAVYKLCESGGRPVMKFSTKAKRSLPGHPVVFRRTLGDGPVSCIGQLGELPPRGFEMLGPSKCPPYDDGFGPARLSPATSTLIAQLESTYFS